MAHIILLYKLDQNMCDCSRIVLIVFQLAIVSVCVYHMQWECEPSIDTKDLANVTFFYVEKTTH